MRMSKLVWNSVYQESRWLSQIVQFLIHLILNLILLLIILDVLMIWLKQIFLLVLIRKRFYKQTSNTDTNADWNRVFYLNNSAIFVCHTNFHVGTFDAKIIWNVFSLFFQTFWVINNSGSIVSGSDIFSPIVYYSHLVCWRSVVKWSILSFSDFYRLGFWFNWLGVKFSRY